MYILDDFAAFDKDIYPQPVLALGNFDGVHRGHQAILRRVVARAAALHGTSMAVTFTPHPLQVLAPEKAPLLLTTQAQKMHLIAGLGITVCLNLFFTEQFARQSPLTFLRDVLCTRLGVHELVLGADFRFGHRRLGTVDFLQAQAAVFGYEVTVLPTVMQDGIVVNSSYIRHAIQQGHVEQAASLLGRHYAIEGLVVAECWRTRSGFPMADVLSHNTLLPYTGAYAVQVGWSNQRALGIAYVDNTPLHGQSVSSVEVHLCESGTPLYGAFVRVEFLHRLHEALSCASTEEWDSQIASDIQQVRQLCTL